MPEGSYRGGVQLRKGKISLPGSPSHETTTNAMAGPIARPPGRIGGATKELIMAPLMIDWPAGEAQVRWPHTHRHQVRVEQTPRRVLLRNAALRTERLPPLEAFGCPRALSPGRRLRAGPQWNIVDSDGISSPASLVIRS